MPARRAIIATAITTVVVVVVLAVVLTARHHPQSSPAVLPAPAPPGSGPVRTVALTPVNNAQEKGAVCLDGSTPQYHLDRGSGAGADKWIIHLQGGGWCETLDSCSERSRTIIGSSIYMDSIEFVGIVSSFPSHNPDFYNWNRVVVRYCDGASFSGDMEGEVEHNEVKLFFRGQRIWEAVMGDLLSKGLADAKQALLTGCSAGGLATYLHCDNFKELLPRVGTVKCLGDAGLFLNEKDVSGKRTGQSYFKDIVQLQNVNRSLQKDCLSTTEPSECFFASEIIKYIATPIFVLNSAYDYWQLENLLAPESSDPQDQWLRCKENIQNCNANQVQFLQGFRESMLNSLKELQNSTQGGVFINSCCIHCQTTGNDMWHSPESSRIGNKTAAEAVGDWFFGRREVKEVDCAYPCNPSCHMCHL